MTRSAQGGDLLQQHLLGNAAQAVAHQGQEKFLVLYRRGLRRRGWLVVFFHGWWFLGFLLPLLSLAAEPPSTQLSFNGHWDASLVNALEISFASSFNSAAQFRAIANHPFAVG
jgi:ABC-type sulfate transport system permease component